MHPRIAPFSLALLVVATVACGSEATNEPATEPISSPAGTELPVVEATSPDDTPVTSDEMLAPDTIVFVWAETGGCAMMGPNCARYEITFDGSVSTYREGGTEVAAIGSIDAELVRAWIDAVDSVDVDELQRRVGEGEMTAAFDGTDVVVSAPFADLELSSVETRFAPDEPVIAAAQALAAAALESAAFELEQR